MKKYKLIDFKYWWLIPLVGLIGSRSFALYIIESEDVEELHDRGMQFGLWFLIQMMSVIYAVIKFKEICL